MDQLIGMSYLICDGVDATYPYSKPPYFKDTLTIIVFYCETKLFIWSIKKVVLSESTRSKTRINILLHSRLAHMISLNYVFLYSGTYPLLDV